MSFSIASSLPDIISMVKPSIVGVGTYQQTRRPPSKLMGTGFVVLNGNYVVTNAHVVNNKLEEIRKESLSIFVRQDEAIGTRMATILVLDEEHDLALLKINGAPLPALKIGNSKKVREGQPIAFTGFPIGAVLGLHPVTHRGIVAAITPVIIPVHASSMLNPQLIKRMQSPYKVFQLDATAYPGNSGSPVYDKETGKVIGVINKVFVKETKETVLEKPSGITYAIPARYVNDLFDKIE